MHDKILVANKKNLVKNKFLFIDTFDPTRPAMVHAIRDLTVGVF